MRFSREDLNRRCHPVLFQQCLQSPRLRDRNNGILLSMQHQHGSRLRRHTFYPPGRNAARKFDRGADPPVVNRQRGGQVPS